MVEKKCFAMFCQNCQFFGCTPRLNRFGHVWISQGVDNQKQFLNAFETRCRDIYSQQCLSEIRDSSRCRMYKEIKLSFSASYYVKFNIHQNLRICFTKLRLSSHKLLVERTMDQVKSPIQ